MMQLDGTENKGRLGANAMLAVSMATGARRGGRGRRAALLHLAKLHGAQDGGTCCRCR